MFAPQQCLFLKEQIWDLFFFKIFGNKNNHNALIISMYICQNLFFILYMVSIVKEYWLTSNDSCIATQTFNISSE